MKDMPIAEAMDCLEKAFLIFLDKQYRPDSGSDSAGLLPPRGTLDVAWARDNQDQWQLNVGIGRGNFVADVNRANFKHQAKNYIDSCIHVARPHMGGSGWSPPHFSANGVENENLVFHDGDVTFNFHLPCRPPACPLNGGGGPGGAAGGAAGVMPRGVRV
jgi:hypothetical protein